MPPLPGLADARRDVLLLASAGVVAVALGVAAAGSPMVAGAATAGVAVVAVAWRLGALAITALALALLPWMVILEGVMPRLMGTFATTAAAIGLLLCVAPLRFRSVLIPLSATGFVGIVIAHVLYANDGEQYIMAAKYMIFPALAIAVCSENAREVLPRLKIPLIASCMAAMSLHIVLIALSIGRVNTYYGVGERLGLSADWGPHALALLTTMIAGAGLAVQRPALRISLFALGAVPALMTGVRSAQLGILIMLLVFLWQSSSKWRSFGVLFAAIAIAVVSGAADVVTTRFVSESAEFSSFSSAGSERGLIWTVALSGWEAAGPLAWFFGAGLRSVVEFEIAAIATDLVGHSDFVEVVVQLGIVGFVAWVGLWIGLLRARLAPTILLALLAFGLVNGSLEYLPALAVGLCLAAACAYGDEGSTAPTAGRRASGG